MKLIAVLVSLSVTQVISSEFGPEIAGEQNAVLNSGFLAPEDAFKFYVNCISLEDDDCPLVKWLVINLGMHSMMLAN